MCDFFKTDLEHPFENFTQHGTVTSDALGTPFAAFALGVLSAFACNGLFAEAADLVEKAWLSICLRGGRLQIAGENASMQ